MVYIIDQIYQVFNASKKLIFSVVKVDSYILYDVVWHKTKPLKASFHVWQLLLNDLRIKDKSIKRGIMLFNIDLYSSGYGKEESVDNLFVFCTTFSSI